jgi:hypothetical protein
MDAIDAICREEMEWANLWWSHADDLATPRVLLIGDSIVVGYSQTVMTRLQGVAHIDRLANSRGINDPALAKELCYMLSEYRYSAIHFNNGLHGAHISDDVYARGLHAMVQLLMLYGQGARLVWGHSTPVTRSGEPTELDADTNGQVLRRNAVAVDIMGVYEIPVTDLYGLVVGHPALRSLDGYHYNEQGQTLLGEAVAAAIQHALG